MLGQGSEHTQRRYMDNKKTLKMSAPEKRQRRTQNVALTEAQLEALIQLWKGWHGGAKAFAEKMAEKENADSNVAAISVPSKQKVLRRIEDRDTGVSQATFKTIADVCGVTTKELEAKISAPVPEHSMAPPVGPWITDEKVLSEYRRVYYGYYYTKQGTDYFWMHHVIDFSAPYPGCLHATMNYGIDRPIHYKVYAYVFREMLIAITQGVDESTQLESVAIYHDFRRPIREHVGHFSVRMNEDWNGDFGVGASIMLRRPIKGAEKEGRQDYATSAMLTEYWKNLDGERCNRLLSLFGCDPVSGGGASVEPPVAKRRLAHK